MKISIDKKKCIGCGACASVCPEVFEMKDGKANAKVKQSDAACAKQAADGCPVKAISIK